MSTGRPPDASPAKVAKCSGKEILPIVFTISISCLSTTMEVLLANLYFPTLSQSPIEQFPSTQHVRNAVCDGTYWAAIYANHGATASLAAALGFGAGTGSTNLESLTFIWNGARYPAFSQGDILTNIEALVQVTRSAYYLHNASYVIGSVDLENEQVLNAFLDPIQATEINLQSTNLGNRVFYNTISMVMPILQQFFFIIALNGISAQFRVFTRLPWAINALFRAALATFYTFIAALCTTGYIWGFKEDWDVGASQFVLSWMAYWLYMKINFLFFEIMTTFLPVSFIPFGVLTWVLVNVASTISPFELNPTFFRWAYALPSHEAYQLLVQIWSNGCDNQSYRALPIMFTWWIVCVPIAVLCVRYRCITATAAERASETSAVKVQQAQKDSPDAGTSMSI
ncbi:SNG1 family protein [Talaromyces stipitatus ATCC 10500]|uniref:SNG1 family protein n=1 Tax=Talaromyces stipitatus (strain ATCC 10500 / CBS 375.48 / QM 6759 / NRRL 1006) TaxID=441959 RepID=B8ME97_TALSN|nr:SNG1 family protein [Talaromyces stipitatus ATCC 10500]EED16524.1 SNG1 family protein [Talaromyces stipitatus ATCC 10500]